MTLPHSLFGAQVHAANKRHWWQRHPLPKLRRHPVQATEPAPLSPRDVFTRVPEPRLRHASASASAHEAPPEALIVAPLLLRGGRNAQAETETLNHFAEVGYQGAAAALQGASPRVVVRVADAACAAGADDNARSLYALAHAEGGEQSCVPQQLQRRAHTAANAHDAHTQRVLLQAWMDTQPLTFQILARGCLQSCALNPGLTYGWYLQARELASESKDAVGLAFLSRTLLQSLAYAMLMDRAPADARLLEVLETSDPKLLSWVANAAAVAGDLEVSEVLERRAQELSAGLPPSHP